LMNKVKTLTDEIAAATPAAASSLPLTTPLPSTPASTSASSTSFSTSSYSPYKDGVLTFYKIEVKQEYNDDLKNHGSGNIEKLAIYLLKEYLDIEIPSTNNFKLKTRQTSKHMYEITPITYKPGFESVSFFDIASTTSYYMFYCGSHQGTIDPANSNSVFKMEFPSL